MCVFLCRLEPWLACSLIPPILVMTSTLNATTSPHRWLPPAQPNRKPTIQIRQQEHHQAETQETYFFFIRPHHYTRVTSATSIAPTYSRLRVLFRQQQQHYVIIYPDLTCSDKQWGPRRQCWLPGSKGSSRRSQSSDRTGEMTRSRSGGRGAWANEKEEARQVTPIRTSKQDSVDEKGPGASRNRGEGSGRGFWDAPTASKGPARHCRKENKPRLDLKTRGQQVGNCIFHVQSHGINSLN